MSSRSLGRPALALHFDEVAYGSDPGPRRAEVRINGPGLRLCEVERLTNKSTSNVGRRADHIEKTVIPLSRTHASRCSSSRNLLLGTCCWHQGSRSISEALERAHCALGVRALETDDQVQIGGRSQTSMQHHGHTTDHQLLDTRVVEGSQDQVDARNHPGRVWRGRPPGKPSPNSPDVPTCFDAMKISSSGPSEAPP